MTKNTIFDVSIKSIIEETKDSATIIFDTKNHNFNYLAGQYITVILNIDGSEQRRAYSLSSSPSFDKHFGITVKRVKGGLVSNYLIDNLKEGNEIKILPPQGKFMYEASQKAKELYLFAGGSGITPMYSILKTALQNSANVTKVNLVYANRDLESIIFKQELKKLEEEYAKSLQVTHVLSQENSSNWTGLRGRINAETVSDSLKASKNKKDIVAYMCGPEGMMSTIESCLNDYGLDSAQILKEKFVSTETKELPLIEENQNFESSDVTIVYEGEEHRLSLKPEDNILDKALDADLDLPYSCQSGLCTACMAKCEEGEIMMTEEDGVSDDEREDGYFLPCVSHPKSQKIKIVFD